ncbi:MAG: ribonuclease III [Methanomethylovorans sp. PtaU1.Bin073]|nr:MAG: ribonuclease III [Methanomethylovorans sp. PtaU1.Bin073]
MKNNGSIESVIGYSFKNKDLLDQALTTKAYSNEHGCKDQSEFQTIGDAVLKLVLTETMMQKGNVTRENITTQRIELEKKEGIARVARKLDIRPFMKIGNGQKIQNHIESDHVLAETLEAIAGAIFLDGGLDNTKDLMAGWFEE